MPDAILLHIQETCDSLLTIVSGPCDEFDKNHQLIGRGLPLPAAELILNHDVTVPEMVA